MTANRAPSSEQGAPARDAGESVREIVTALLAAGSRAATIEVVAERMRTSVRTLQRRLRATGLTYSEVVQQARRMAAQRLLSRREAGIGVVARSLGYSDPAHFTRAFQRWTGSTPRDFRARSGADRTPRRRTDR